MGSQLLCFLTLILILLITTRVQSRQLITIETCHPDDLKGLAGFKAAIQLDSSGRLKTWTGNGCCKWAGISCDNKNGRVTEINLPGFYMTPSYDAPVQPHMSGSLSNSITLLTFLEVIDLSCGLGAFPGGLTGNIPPSIGFHLPSLRRLLLLGNNFNGRLPDSIGNLTKLETLDLHENNFTGPLPDSLGNLKKLKYLDLNSNGFTGAIPNSISNLTNLEILYLQYNFLSEKLPDNIGALQALKEVDISDNKLSGKLPESFGQLTALETVRLPNNKLVGPIPKSFGNLRNLYELYLYNNRLSGQIPSSFGQLSQLMMLNLAHNMLQEHLPKEMASLQNLGTLDLSFNRFNLVSIPDWLLKFPGFYEIQLAGCKIRGALSEYLQSISSSLEDLDLSHNDLTGEIPASIDRLTELSSLNLAGNALTGQIPSTIRNLVNLQELDLSYNNLTGEIPANIDRLSELYSLNLAGNALNGQIPSTIRNLALGEINLRSNELEGSIRYVFERYDLDDFVKPLRNIDLSDNHFSTGVEQIGTGTHHEIKYLNLSHNVLKGKVPNSIGTLGSLETLDLSYNDIESELPSSLGNLSSLGKLKLQHNKFTGKIPNELLKLKKLTELDLSNNKLEGEIPSGKPLIDFPRSSYLPNKGLCGKPLSPCVA